MDKNTMMVLFALVVIWLLLSGRTGAIGIGGQIMENEETIKWTDYRGQERVATVTRKVVLQ